MELILNSTLIQDISEIIVLLFCVIVSVISHTTFLYSRDRTLVLFDSRGVPVQRLLDDPAVICKSYRGARLQDISKHAERLIPRYQPVSCLVVAGINNLTTRIGRTGTVSLLYYDSFELANHLIRLINRVRSKLLERFPSVNLCFGGILGMNLNMYNRRDGYSPYQWILDDAVRQINAYIRLLSQQSYLYFPRLTSKVHSYYRGKPKNNYRLLYDGLHLGPILRQNWSISIMRFHWVNTKKLAPIWAQ